MQSEATAQNVAGISSGMTLLLASACGFVAANVYYAQPLIGPISQSLHIPAEAAGLVVTMTQLGYCLGLIFIVPLGDLVENRRLVLCVLAGGILALLAAGAATAPGQFLAAALFIGVGSVAVQILVPYAAHLADDSNRGRVVGNITGGLMLGIMLARPVSSFITSVSSWRVVFFAAATVILLVALALAIALPPRSTPSKLSYGQLVASLGELALRSPVLQRRIFYHALLFGAFSLFWTTVPLLLAGPDFRLSQSGIALFALAGAAGAVAAPLAGRLADRGLTKSATMFAMFIVAAAFLMTHVGASGSALALICLVIAAIALDFGVQTNGVLGQRAILTLAPEARSRLNGLYIASFFLAGALGSALGAWAYATGGWAMTSRIGIVLPLAGLVFVAMEPSKNGRT